MVDKIKAVQLRQDGLTYPEIAELLGCSLGWCKVNLNGVLRGSPVVERVKVDATKEAAIEILKAALARLEGL